MDLFQPIILLTSPFVLAAYICRLAMLSLKKNRPLVILFHMALAMSTGWAGYRAYLGDPQFGDVAAVIGAACWIAISFKSWKMGVPEHFTNRPRPLDTEDWINVQGGQKK